MMLMVIAAKTLCFRSNLPLALPSPSCPVITQCFRGNLLLALPFASDPVMFCPTMNVLMLNFLLRCDCIIIYIYVYDMYCLVFFFSLSWHPSFYLPCIILLCDSSLCDCMYYIYMYRCFSPPSLFLPVCQWHVAFDLSYLLQIHNSTPVLIVRLFPPPSPSLPPQPTPHASIPYVDPTNSTCNSSGDFVPFRTMSALMFIFQGLSLNAFVNSPALWNWQ